MLTTATKKLIAVAALLFGSNFFMNAAWYGHLKYKNAPMIGVIFASWGIAFFEYCLQVPANRIGDGPLSIVQLKVTQEFMSLTTFAIFSSIFLGQKLKWNNLVSFALIVLAAWFSFKQW